MKLLFKKPSINTKIAMSNLAIGKKDSYEKDSYEKDSYEKIVKEKITKITGHKYGCLVNSGNSAILLTMNSIKGPIIVPDQGAWHGFKQIANFLNKKLIILKTNKGLVEINYLNNILDKVPKNSNPALFLTSFAAYTAEQNIKLISKWCSENNILLIEDSSGSFLDPKKKLANGKYSDVILCSTGSPKIINVEDGGFITTNNPEVFENSKILLKTLKTNEITACGINSELKFTQNNLITLIKSCNYLKNNLDNIIHKDKRGINIIFSCENPKELYWNLKEEINVEGRSIITKCPNYNRLKEKALAIEIKNLDTKCLTKENLDNIINIIKKYQ